MSNQTPDEFHGLAGSFEIRDGKRVRTEEATREHPDGNRPRSADGKPLAGPDGHLQPPVPPAPAPRQPARSKGGEA